MVLIVELQFGFHWIPAGYSRGSSPNLQALDTLRAFLAEAPEETNRRSPLLLFLILS